MELDKIEKLLTDYFEGNTSLQDEVLLMDYFNNQKVADHLLQYKPIFIGLAAAKNEHSDRVYKLEEETPKRKNQSWRYAVAALFLVAFGIGAFFLSPSQQMTQEEQEALTAFEDSKKAMLFLSENFNKGIKQLSYVDQFGIATDKVWKDAPDEN